MASRTHTPAAAVPLLRVITAQEREFLAAVRRMDPVERTCLRRAMEHTVAGMPFEASVAAFRREVRALRGRAWA
jgi:hypothetical protein